MSRVNRITKAVAQIVIVTAVLAAVFMIWVVYIRFPAMRNEIRTQTAAAVNKWFPLGEDGSFSYETSVDLKKKECSLKEFSVFNGAGSVLDDLDLKTYWITADSIDLELSGTVEPRPVRIKSVDGFNLEGEVPFAEISNYFTTVNSGMEVKGIRYDDFTEMVILNVEITELVGIETEMVGNLKINDEGDLLIDNRRYRNPDSPVDEGVVGFIEEHTDPRIRFRIFGIPLRLKEFSVGESSLSITLID